VPKKNDPPDLSINKGIELMLRRKNKDPLPKNGFGFKKSFSLCRRNWYFNIDLRWEKNTPS
tara:strand:+ start:212 stop:394 length:183 start_codon:yes stop_codon:yes gene_type:complete